jgi:NitT/TauT family transport system permease protein
MSRSSRGGIRALVAIGPVLITGLVILAGWVLVSLMTTRVPSPWATGSHLAEMFADGSGFSILGRTALFMAVCFSIAAGLGVAIGLFLGTHAGIDRGLSPYLAALQAMPTGMWIPVAAVVLGTSVSSLAAVVTIGAMPAIILGTRSAVKNIPPLILRAGNAFGERGLSRQRRVVLPAALPGILTGLELGWSIAFRCLVAGEIFSGALGGTGIGRVISRSRESGDLTEMLATIVIIMGLSIAVDRLLFSRIQNRLRHTRGLVDSGLPH